MQCMWDVGHCGWLLCQDCFNVVLGGRGSLGHFLDIRGGKKGGGGECRKTFMHEILARIPLVFFLSLSP